MPNDNFEQAVAFATAEAAVSRKELGSAYAAEFNQNPDGFEPRKLVILGREGLQSFVTDVSVPTCSMEPLNDAPAEVAGPGGDGVNWSTAQMVPWPFEIRALLLGSIGGIGLVFGCALLLNS